MIYFDNNATTAILPEVREALTPYLEEGYGNPSSIYSIGNRSRVAIDKARAQVAEALGVTPGEIVFTGSGSEANNQAILGTVFRDPGHLNSGKNIVISTVEHPATRCAAEWVARKFGVTLRVAPIKIEANRILAEPFIRAIDEHTLLVSVMLANNETGVLLPVKEIFQAAKERGALCHTDAIQGFGKVPVSPKELGADLLSIAGHKIHAPKGVGALFIRRGLKIDPLIHGGSQESGRRSGTENIINNVALGKAAEIAVASSKEPIRKLRDYFEAKLVEIWGSRVCVNFQNVARTPNASSVQFKKQDGNLLVIKLDGKGVCASTGSACNSGSLSASKGLLAMGLTEKEATSTLRFSFSKLNTKAEVNEVLAILQTLLPAKN